MYQLVAERLDIGNEQAIGVLTALQNLRRQRTRYDLTNEQFLEDLESLLKEEDPESLLKEEVNFSEEKREPLLRLVKKTDEHRIVEELAVLKYALLPHVVDATTVVDMRPVFNASRDKLEAMLLVTSLELATHDHATDEHVQIRVRLTKKKIDLLLDKLSDAKLKLEKLQDQFQEYDIYQ